LDSVLVDMRGFVDRRAKNLLLASADDGLRTKAMETIGNSDVHTTTMTTAGEVQEALARQPFDCLVVDAALPDRSGLDLMERVAGDGTSRPHVPVVVYAGTRLDEAAYQRVERLARTGAIRAAASMEELFDATSLVLHRVASALPDDRRSMLERLYPSDGVLAGRTVLIVDDDVRNRLATTSLREPP